jgi:hypothetical protein
MRNRVAAMVAVASLPHFNSQTSQSRRVCTSSSVHRGRLSSPQAHGTVEVDHSIPIELGGRQHDRELWAEPASPTHGFNEKDRAENYLHKEVRAGEMTVASAQRLVATDLLHAWRDGAERASMSSSHCNSLGCRTRECREKNNDRD